MPSTPSDANRVRPFTPEDIPSVRALLVDEAGAAPSERWWHWLFAENPARAPDDERPTGWVIDGDGGVAGYLANIHVDYAVDTRRVRGAALSTYYVRPQARRAAIALMSAAFRQEGVDLLLTTSANENSAPIYEMFKARHVHDPYFQARNLWVVDDVGFLRIVAARGDMPARGLQRLLPLAAPGLKVARMLTGYATLRRSRWDGRTEEVAADAVGEAFDTLWEKVRATGATVAWRDADTLRWRMRHPDLAPTTELIAAYDTEGLAGYALAARHRPFRAEVPRYKVFDILLRPGALEAAGALLHHASRLARRHGAAVVEVSRCGPWLKPALAPLRPLVHRTALHEHLLKSKDPELMRAMLETDRWLATSYDGDTAFTFRDSDLATRGSGIVVTRPQARKPAPAG